MKIKKAIYLLTIIGLLLVTVLAGCGKNQQSSGEASSDKVQVVLSGWGSSPEEAKLLEQTIEAFESKYPNIDVKLDIIADQYMDVMKTRLIGGNAADVFYLEAFEAPALIATGVIEPLDSYVTEEFDINDFEKPLLEAFQKDGITYGFPKDYSTLALFYNKKMFADAGIEKPPVTWEELLDYSKKLTKGTAVYGFGVAPELARLTYIGEALGGKVVKDDKANFADQKVVNALQNIVDQHLIDKTSAQPSEVGANWGGEMFGQQKVAMVIEGNWAIPFLDNTFPDVDYGIAEVPTINGKNGTMAFTVAYVMNSQSKHKQEAWQLISFLTGKEGMEIWTSKGLALPTRKSVAAKLGFNKDEKRAALVVGANYATVWQNGPNLPTITTNFNNQFVSAFLGERSLQEALLEAQEQANSEIKRD